MEHRPEPLTPFLTWRGLEKAILTLHCLTIRGQEPHLRRIRHLRPPRPRPFHLLRVECPLILLSADTRCGDHRLHPRQLLRALRAHVLLACHRKPSSNDLWSPRRPLREIQIVEPNHSIPSYILTLRSSRALGFIWTALESMTTHGPRSPIAIHFSIDGRQSILEVKHVAKALHISYELMDPTDFREWSPVSQRDMVHILSRGTSVGSVLLQGFYFGPHHLIMASLLHFEEKVDKKKLKRADTIPLLFPRLLYHILEYMGYPTKPHLEHRYHCRERFTLDKWTQLVGYSAPLGAPPRPSHPVPPHAEQA
ncbi:hypothetical protein CK203_064085 [Vitis vinifera]|uniref:Uncharacterized protein n=1 Tax=Vitis vinifera TaxID=29760 RepID=A0A438G3Y4_VITVI|nr:hypothetical protein CK203_064085 [Vitis vinifera]